MANASFTRDEVILALDVLYSNGGIAPEPESVEIQQLSRLLHRLPIHPVATRKKDFRTPTGVQAQISRYQHRYENMVGVMFYKIDSEFENRYDELHAIAKAIRRNVAAFEETIFGDPLEGEEFPEGILLGHLHRIVETRDSAKLVPGKRCEIYGVGRKQALSGKGVHHRLSQLPCRAAPAQAMVDKRELRRTAPLREGGKCHVWV